MTLKEAREAHGWSRAEYSRISGIPLRTIENWELGYRKPSNKWMEDLLIRDMEHLAQMQKEKTL